MSSPPAHEAKRFGWITPDKEKGGDHFNFTICANDFPSKAWSEFEDLVGIMAALRPYVIDYVSLLKELDELVDLEATLAQEWARWAPPLNWMGTGLIEAHASAQRIVFNVLSAASAFRDRTKMRLVETYGKNSTELAVYEAAVTAAYDQSSEYRICYNLRNFSQHIDSPLHLLPTKAKRNDEGKLEYTVRVELQRDIILEKSRKLVAKRKIQRRFLDDLAGQNEQIRALPLFKTYVTQLGNILEVLMGQRADRLAQYADYIQFVFKSSNLPDYAIPYIFEGPASEMNNIDISINMQIHSFSIDEFNYMKKLLQWIRLGSKPMSE